MTDTEEAAEAKAPPLRILIVDDNKDAADSLGVLLRMWGFDVRVAYDGREALTAASAYRPHCLLSDIGLPGIEGYHLAEHVRRDEALQGITLVAITAYSDEARAKAAGFDHHFVKPADQHAVEKMLRKVRAMGKRLDQKEELGRQQGEVVPEARDVMKEVKQEVREMRQELTGVKGKQERV
jgi:two-component system, OmpR family, response regulator